MMNFKITNRQSILIAITFLYLIPLLFFSGYSVSIMPRSKSWLIISIGLLMIAAGAILFLTLIRYLQHSYKDIAAEEPVYGRAPELEKVTHFDPTQMEEEREVEANDLQFSLEKMQEELGRLEEEKRLISSEASQIADEFNDYKGFSEEQLKQKSLQIQALQLRIEDQQEEQKKLQEQIDQLTNKNSDLSFEIRTLLSIHPESAQETSPDPGKTDETINFQSDQSLPFTDTEASLLLKRCIDTAQKITGSNYYRAETSKYRNYTPTLSTIDLRRLYDSLRLENETLIIVYSPKEQKFLFANQQSKNLLGWGADKLVQDFSVLIQDGLEGWENAVKSLSVQPESQIRLLLKTKTGQDLFMECRLSLIPSGLFKHYIIGVLYPTT